LNGDGSYIFNILIVSWELILECIAVLLLLKIPTGTTHADVFEVEFEGFNVEFEGFKVEFKGFKVEFDPFTVPPAPAASAVPLEPGLLKLPAAAVPFSELAPGDPAGLVAFPVALLGLPEVSPPQTLH
jgi:hypothetical protein